MRFSLFKVPRELSRDGRRLFEILLKGWTRWQKHRLLERWRENIEGVG